MGFDYLPSIAGALCFVLCVVLLVIFTRARI